MVEELRLRVIRDCAGIEEIRDAWSAWHHHPNSDIDFYLAVLRTMPGVLRPHVIALYRGGIPQALLIGRLEQSQINLKVGYKTFLRANVRLITFIYKGYLGEISPENTEALVREVSNSLERKEADAAMLSHVGVDSPLYASGRSVPGFLRRDHAMTVSMHRSMNLPGSADEVYGGLSGKVRKNLKSQSKKFVSDFSGNVKVRTFRDVAEFEEMIGDLEHVAAKTYQRGLGVGFNDSAEMRERLRLQTARGWLRAFVLYIGDKPCAFWVGTLYQNTFCSDFMGYDPEYSKYSPGMFLIMQIVEDFCGARNGDRPQQIDFGFGDAQYKTVLANAEWRESSVYMFAPTFKAAGLNLLRIPAAFVNQWATEFLGKTSLLLKVKRIWRDRVIKT